MIPYPGLVLGLGTGYRYHDRPSHVLTRSYQNGSKPSKESKNSGYAKGYGRSGGVRETWETWRTHARANQYFPLFLSLPRLSKGNKKLRDSRPSFVSGFVTEC